MKFGRQETNDSITPQSATNLPEGKQSVEAQQNQFQVQAPSINLPKGGGAIRGMGEKFAAKEIPPEQVARVATAAAGKEGELLAKLMWGPEP